MKGNLSSWADYAFLILQAQMNPNSNIRKLQKEANRSGEGSWYLLNRINVCGNIGDSKLWSWFPGTNPNSAI